MAEGIERSSLGSKVYDILRDRITSVQILPDERLDISKLADEFQTSTIPVREALKQLTERGLVTSVPGVGYRAATYSTQDITDILEFRGVLELLALQDSFTKIPSRRLSALAARNERLISQVDDLNAHAIPDEVDYELHVQCIVGFAGNRYLKDTYDRLYDRISIAKHLAHRYPDVIAEHREIIRALLKRDMQAARRTLDEHLRRTASACVKAAEGSWPSVAMTEDKTASH